MLWIHPVRIPWLRTVLSFVLCVPYAALDIGMWWRIQHCKWPKENQECYTIAAGSSWDKQEGNIEKRKGEKGSYHKGLDSFCFLASVS